MTESPEALAAELAALVERVGRIASYGDAIDQLARFELLRSEEAAVVGGRDTSTLARWAAAAEDEGMPIAIKVGTTWLFVTSRLLVHIEHASGLYGRREAETRLRKLIEMRAGGQSPNQTARPRARGMTNCD
jgi:hypothetical protein